MAITVAISVLVGIATSRKFSPGNLFREEKSGSKQLSQFALLGRLPRAIDLDELAVVAVGALLFSKARKEARG